MRKKMYFCDRVCAEIKNTHKTAFFACVIAGFLVHLFAFTNIIPNSDGLSRVFDEQQMTVSGRWFLHYASMFHGYVQAPMLIGSLSVLFLAVAAVLTVDVLQIRSRLASGLCGIFMVVFPSVAYTNMFVFTASAYGFGILLAVLSVWLCRRWPKVFPLAAIPLACAVGTYQAYFAVAASLALCCVICDLLQQDMPLRKVVVQMVKLLTVLLVGAVLYYLILRLFLWAKDLELLSYRGMNVFGKELSFAGILNGLRDTYEQFCRYFWVPGTASYVTVPLILVQDLLFLAGGAALVVRLIRGGLYRQPGRIALLLLAGAMMPLIFNFSEMLADSSPVMRYSLVFAYILPLVLLDHVNENESRWLRGTACVAGAGIILLCAQIANTAYTTSATAHRATQAFATNLVSRVESLPGYRSDMDVIVIGSFPDDVYYNGVEGLALAEHKSSCLSSSVMPLNKHIYYYLNDWLNVPWEEPGEDEMTAVAESEEFQSMPLYPSDGSVAIMDGQVIVRLAQTYTPKQDFEIAYENRR